MLRGPCLRELNRRDPDRMELVAELLRPGAAPSLEQPYRRLVEQVVQVLEW
jgi:hypothetical protein